MDEFIPAGGTAVAYKWLTDLEGPDGPELWHALDENLRLCFAQGWLMGTDQDELETRDKTSDALVKGEHKLFYKMLHHLTNHWRHVYRDLNYEPALIGATDVVAPDMELVMFTSDEFAGRQYSAGDQIPAHSFITRYIDGVWKIAATARRLPVPGWPPTEHEIVGLRY